MPRLLDEIRIASPCPMRWAQLKGDQRVRFCASCKKHVYNLAEMEPDEAERLIRRTEGPICGRLYRRRDGTLLAGDCPKGALRLYRRLVGAMVAAAALVLGSVVAARVARVLFATEVTGMIGATEAPVPVRRAPLELRSLAQFGQALDEQPLQRSR